MMHPEHTTEMHNAAQSLRDLEALATGNFKCNGVFLQTDVEVPACKEAMTSKEASRTGLRHIATEQRRRDRINEGFAALRKLLPRAEKADKASFLISAAEYIKELQCNLQALIESSALSHLDPDLQWSLRMLLPRGRRLTAKIQPVLCTAGPVQPAAGELAPAAQPAPLVQPAQAQSDHMLAVLAALLSAQAPAPQVQVPAAQAQLAQLLLAAQKQAQQLPSPITAASAAPPPQQLTVVAVPKARKNVKVRRHTSASRIEKPVLPHAPPVMDAGRPNQAVA